jgi:hypothetical protein
MAASPDEPESSYACINLLGERMNANAACRFHATTIPIKKRALHRRNGILDIRFYFHFSVKSYDMAQNKNCEGLPRSFYRLLNHLHRRYRLHHYRHPRRRCHHLHRLNHYYPSRHLSNSSRYYHLSSNQNLSSHYRRCHQI